MKIVGIIAIAFVLFIPTSVFAQIIDFTTDKETYYQFQTITISGVVDVVPDISDIKIRIGGFGERFISINPDGTFSFEIQTNPDVFYIDGEYPIKITYVNSIERSFNYQQFRDIAPFVDQSKNPCSYVDRYDNEPAYEKWFRDNYPEYISIYEAVGIQDKKEICKPEPKPVKTADDQYRMICLAPDGYCMSKYGMNNPDAYGECLGTWVPFCRAYEAKQTQEPEHATMTSEMQQRSSGGGCLIATATYGSELAPQVQQLREIRDNFLLQTESGRSFMESFNQFYYSFSPEIADLERENPIFKKVVKLTITPLLSSLSLLNYVDIDSEAEMLGYGISLIILNVGMYFVAPIALFTKLKKMVST